MEEILEMETPETAEQPAGEEEESPREEEDRDILAGHVAEMLEKHPTVDILRLEQNPAFRRFAGSRYGRESLAELYEDFTSLVSEAEKSAYARAEAKHTRNTGGSGGGAGGTVLSAGEREALRRWNEANPDMKMTEKEFSDRR